MVHVQLFKVVLLILLRHEVLCLLRRSGGRGFFLLQRGGGGGGGMNDRNFPFMEKHYFCPAEEHKYVGWKSITTSKIYLRCLKAICSPLRIEAVHLRNQNAFRKKRQVFRTLKYQHESNFSWQPSRGHLDVEGLKLGFKRTCGVFN